MSPPTVTVDVQGTADPVGGVAVTFDVVFSEAVVGFDGTRSICPGRPRNPGGDSYWYRACLHRYGYRHDGRWYYRGRNRRWGCHRPGWKSERSVDQRKNSVNYIHSGIVQLSSATFTETELNAPMAVITVTRTDGSSGPLSVDYATGGGTARPGATNDYLSS